MNPVETINTGTRVDGQLQVADIAAGSSANDIAAWGPSVVEAGGDDDVITLTAGSSFPASVDISNFFPAQDWRARIDLHSAVTPYSASAAQTRYLASHASALTRFAEPSAGHRDVLGGFADGGTVRLFR